MIHFSSLSSSMLLLLSLDCQYPTISIRSICPPTLCQPLAINSPSHSLTLHLSKFICISLTLPSLHFANIFALPTLSLHLPTLFLIVHSPSITFSFCYYGISSPYSIYVSLFSPTLSLLALNYLSNTFLGKCV